MDNNKRLQIAYKVEKRSKENVEFLKERIRLQNEPNFNRVSSISGGSVRIYSQLDIDEQQEKVGLARKVINEIENK